VFLLLVGFAPAMARAQSEPPNLSADQIEPLLTPVPAGLGPPCKDRGHWSNDRIRRATGRLIKRADETIRDGFPAWSDEAYLEYSRTGTRINFEKIIFERQQKLNALVIAACVTNERKYISVLETLLKSVAAEPTWTLSASDPRLENFRGRYSVELNAAEFGGELAQSLYMLDGTIDPEVWNLVRTRIQERLIDPVFAELRHGRGPAWLQEANNWNAVCSAGFLGAVLTLVKDPKQRSEAIATIYRTVETYLRSFGPDGYGSEGMTYWSYGFSRYALIRAYALGATAGQVDFYNRPRVREIALFPYRFQMAPGSVAAFGDALKGQPPDLFTLIYLNRTMNLSIKSLPPNSPATERSTRFTVLALFEDNKLAAKPVDKPVEFPAPRRDYFENAQVLVGRPGAEGNTRVAFTMKATGGGPHSHDDIGSYALTLCGKQIMGDPGRFIYYSADLSDRRHQKVLNSYGHPVPLVDGDLQTVVLGDRAPIKLDLSDAVDRATIDIRQFYKHAHPKSLKREYVYDRRAAGTFSVRDSVEFEREGYFDSPITTDTEFSVENNKKIVFGPGGKDGFIQIDAAYDYRINVETIEKNGLRFSRIGIASTGKIKDGWVQYTYHAPRNGQCP
jgi:hypothetical protein